MASLAAASYRDTMAGILSPVGEPERKARYADVLAAPEHMVAEIVDGELFLSPRPATRHARASSTLGVQLGGPFDRPPGDPDRPGGWWLLDEPTLPRSYARRC